MPGTNVPIPIALSTAPLLGTQTADAIAITGGTIQNVTLTGGAYSPTSLTLPDGSTWTSTGFADTASYTTSNTAVFNLSPSWSFSSTATIAGVVVLSPTLIPTGASAGTTQAVFSSPKVGAGSVNISAFRCFTIQLEVLTGYTGTITTGVGLRINAPVLAGTNPLASYQAIAVGITANGQGITTGTVNNQGLAVAPSTAAAGAGGTVNNYATMLNVGSGSSSGTTNIGLYVSGNGGALSTNYAIYSDSTAPSLITGLLGLGVTNAITASVTQTQVGATALTTQLNRITICANSGDAVRLAALTPGQSQEIYNDGANPASIFPATSGNIDGAGANVAVTLTNAKRAIFTCFATNVIISAQLGVVSA